jgi:hypothetical protein
MSHSCPICNTPLADEVSDECPNCGAVITDVSVSRPNNIELPDHKEHDTEILQTVVDEPSTAEKTFSKSAIGVQDGGHLNASQNTVPVQNDAVIPPKINKRGVISHSNFFGLIRAKVKDVLIKDDETFLTFMESQEIHEWYEMPDLFC